MLALLHRFFQLLLVIAEQDMNFTMRFLADGVNPRTEFLARRVRIFIEQRLNPVVVFLEQSLDRLLLFRSQPQFFRKTSKFLVDRLRRVDTLKLLACRGLLCPMVLSCGETGRSEHEHNPIGKRQRSI